MKMSEFAQASYADAKAILANPYNTGARFDRIKRAAQKYVDWYEATEKKLRQLT